MIILLQSGTGCNLRCVHCSASCGDVPRRDLDAADCALLADRLPSLLGPGEDVEWLWHGGEPTLLSPRDFAAMQETLDAAAARGGHASVRRMQGNAHDLGPEWMEVLLRFDVSLGVSLDGPADLNDLRRRTPDGCGTLDRVVENIGMLRRAGVALSLLCTVGPEHVGREEELLDWMEELALPVRVNPLLRLGRSEAALPAGDYFGILRRLAALSLERGGDVSMEPLEGMFSALLHGTPMRECSCNGRCGRDILAFCPGGEIRRCGRSDEILANIRDIPPDDPAAGMALRADDGRAERLEPVCGGCAIRPLCNGGCPAVHGDAPDPGECAARREFWDWLRGEGLDLLRAALIRRRAGLKEEMRRLRDLRRVLSAEA